MQTTSSQHNCPQEVTHHLWRVRLLSQHWAPHLALWSSAHLCRQLLHLAMSLWGILLDVVLQNSPKYHHLQLPKGQNPKVGNCAMLSLILIVPGPHCGLYGVGFPVLSITLDLNLSIAFCALSFKKSLVKTVLDFLLENHLLLETKRLAGTGLDAFPFQPSPGFQEINQFPQLDTGVLPQK